MKARTILLPSFAIALCLLSSMTFLPPVFASTSDSGNNVVTFNLTPGVAQVAPSVLPKYDLKVHFNPNSLGIVEAKNGISGSCMFNSKNYKVCGEATVKLTLKNAGASTFKTNGACTFTVTPGPNGKKSESFGCAGFPTVSIKAGGHKTYTDTIAIYNWKDGTYKVHFTVDGTIGGTTYKSNTGTVTIIASGNP